MRPTSVELVLNPIEFAAGKLMPLVGTVADVGMNEVPVTAPDDVTAPAFQIPDVRVPTEVSDEAATPAASVVPVSVPAGATTALPEAAVMRPFALTVKVGIDVLDPNVPTLALTAAKVVAKDPVPEPVTSPIKVMVWSPVFVPLRFVPVTVPVEATAPPFHTPVVMVPRVVRLVE